MPAISSNGWHMAFYVEDMDRALAALKAHGAEIQSLLNAAAVVVRDPQTRALQPPVSVPVRLR